MPDSTLRRQGEELYSAALEVTETGRVRSSCAPAAPAEFAEQTLLRQPALAAWPD